MPLVTIHLDAPQQAICEYQIQAQQYPDYISFVTGQAEELIAFEIMARAIYAVFHPEWIDSLSNVRFLRYPSATAPRDLAEFFAEYPLTSHKDQYDLDPAVSAVLIAASPSLNETEPNESALSAFLHNDRGARVQEYLFDIFNQEHVDATFYEPLVKTLLQEAPLSNKAGILTQTLIPDSAPLEKAIYLSHAYGIPIGGLEGSDKIRQFFHRYQKDFSDKNPPQIRFLPSALYLSGDVALSDIRMIQYTLIKPEELNHYAAKVDKAVRNLFQKHVCQTIWLEKQMAKAKQLPPSPAKLTVLTEAIFVYLRRHELSEVLMLMNLSQ